MSRDLEELNYLIEKQFSVINSSITFMKSALEDKQELIEDLYLMKKDTFELLILFRALRDMIVDELAQARYERDNGDMI